VELIPSYNKEFNILINSNRICAEVGKASTSVLNNYIRHTDDAGPAPGATDGTKG